MKGKTVGQRGRAAGEAMSCSGRSRAFSGKVKKGRVISQSEAAGATLPRNTKVT